MEVEIHVQPIGGEDLVRVDSCLQCKMTLMMANPLYPTECSGCGRAHHVQYLHKTISYNDYKTAHVLVEWDFNGWELQYLHMGQLFTCSQLFMCSQLLYMFPVVLCVPSCFTSSQLFYMFPVVLYTLSGITFDV